MVRKAQDPTSYSDCLALALKTLQRGAQTEHMMREKLARRLYAEDVIDAVIMQLKKLDFINDQTYAKNFVEARSRGAYLGTRGLQFKLLQKGVHKELAKEASSLAPDEEQELAYKAGQKKLRTLGRFTEEEQKTKVMRFLFSRGFSQSAVYSAISKQLFPK